MEVLERTAPAGAGRGHSRLHRLEQREPEVLLDARTHVPRGRDSGVRVRQGVLEAPHRAVGQSGQYGQPGGSPRTVGQGRPDTAQHVPLVLVLQGRRATHEDQGRPHVQAGGDPGAYECVLLLDRMHAADAQEQGEVPVLRSEGVLLVTAGEERGDEVGSAAWFVVFGPVRGDPLRGGDRPGPSVHLGQLGKVTHQLARAAAPRHTDDGVGTFHQTVSDEDAVQVNA